MKEKTSDLNHNVFGLVGDTLIAEFVTKEVNRENEEKLGLLFQS
jgi:hypothetical protein